MPALLADERKNARQTACELLSRYSETLTRRKDAGTLLTGRCRPAEVAWFRAYQIQGFLEIDCRHADVAHALVDPLVGVVGSETFFLAAIVSIFSIATGELRAATVAFLASALDLLASLPCEPVFVLGSPVANHEITLARNARSLLQDEKFMDLVGATAAELLTDAWRRLERSGVLEQRLLGRANEPLDPSDTLRARLDAAAAEGAACGLHSCALAGCAATEVHISQFKKCGACKAAAYCCREHQVEDWPAHKAACKAARKAAAPANDL